MKNHELLDLIGGVSEDYVLEAGNNIVKPRFRWKTLAACAACAALVLAAYPVYRAFNPPLHSYTVEQGGALTTQGDIKAPAAGGVSDSMPGGAYVGGDTGNGIDGSHYSVPGQDAPAQEEAAAQYDSLLKNGGIDEVEPTQEWYGGAWIDNSYYPEAKLAVAIVDGFRTEELEARILDWCGTGDVVFCGAKYSLAHLYALQDPAVDAVVRNGDVISCGVGVDVTKNCLGIDVYSESIPDKALAQLAALDPAGDAIRVRLFTGSMTAFGDELYMKGPAPVPGGKTEPVFDGARVEPSVEDAPAPVDDSERAMPAAIPGGIGELPEKKYDGYDAVRDADGQAPAEYDVIEGE